MNPPAFIPNGVGSLAGTRSMLIKASSVVQGWTTAVDCLVAMLSPAIVMMDAIVLTREATSNEATERKLERNYVQVTALGRRLACPRVDLSLCCASQKRRPCPGILCYVRIYFSSMGQELIVKGASTRSIFSRAQSDLVFVLLRSFIAVPN